MKPVILSPEQGLPLGLGKTGHALEVLQARYDALVGGMPETEVDGIPDPAAAIEKARRALDLTARVMRLQPAPQIGQWNWPQLAGQCEEALALLTPKEDAK